MPRDLADVLHYFMPEVDATAADPEHSSTFEPPASPPDEPLSPNGESLIPPGEPPSPPGESPSPNGESPIPPGESPSPNGDLPPRVRDRFEFAPESRSVSPETPPLSILGLPIGDRDVVRAALAWNLSVEAARLGDAALLLAPASNEASPLWPEAGPGPLGTELVLSSARGLAELETHAKELAASHATKTRGRGIVFVRVPPAWISADGASSNAIRWWLLLSSANRRELRHAYDVAERLAAADPAVRIGATIHGVSTISEASAAFEHLARLSHEGFGGALRSYGLLVDDLHVYRAIAAQRPIGLAHPQAPATRALMDVARLLADDARSRTFG